MITSVSFWKYHGLGNDYLVVRHQHRFARKQIVQLARAICARHHGVGADGLLIDYPENNLQIFNPDGSEAEKSGNGLRIYARWLFDQKRVQQDAPFKVNTKGGQVCCQILQQGMQVRVSMGKVYIGPGAEVQLPALSLEHFISKQRLVQSERLDVLGTAMQYYRVNLGNPHCVIPIEVPLEQSKLSALGRVIEGHSDFPHRTNVQFIQKNDTQTIALQIWERGAGITLASGSSATAAAAVARVIGWCDEDVVVDMPGGKLHVHFTVNGIAELTGPVTYICHGQFACC